MDSDSYTSYLAGALFTSHPLAQVQATYVLVQTTWLAGSIAHPPVVLRLGRTDAAFH